MARARTLVAIVAVLAATVVVGGAGVGRATSSSSAGPLAAMGTSPKALKPDFSPGVHDYIIRGDAGVNAIDVVMGAVAGGTVTMLAPVSTAPSRTRLVHVELHENDPIVVAATDSSGHE